MLCFIRLAHDRFADRSLAYSRILSSLIRSLKSTQLMVSGGIQHIYTTTDSEKKNKHSNRSEIKLVLFCVDV